MARGKIKKLLKGTRKGKARTGGPIPTQATYAAFQNAYDVFNRELFEGKMPAALITLNRKDKRSFGYWSHNRFGSCDKPNSTVSELALNPGKFKSHGPMEALQTLGHEMVHGMQCEHGKPSRGGYHNKQFADMMEAIGLMPSHNGQPGGKRVGQSMMDYAIPGGKFEGIAKRLLKDGFSCHWYDRTAELTETSGSGEEGEEGEGDDASASGKRVKFTCGKCKANAWGKASLQLACIPCKTVLKPAKPKGA